MLELNGLSKHFGGVKALDGLDLTVEEGEICGLIGPNGSGKSTTINVICGVYGQTSGTVRFRGELMDGKPPHQRLRAGIARTFQNIRLFPNLTVWQNLWVAQNSHQDIAGRDFCRAGSAPRARREGRLSDYLNWPTLGTKATTSRPISPSESRGASSSRAPRPPVRSCCCSTSRQPA